MQTTGAAVQHKWDRNFILMLTMCVWLGVVMGFGKDMRHHFSAADSPPYLPIVHLHALAFVAWLALFTLQIVLIRRRKWADHRRLGLALGGLAVFMVATGPLTQFLVMRSRLNAPDFDPGFMAIALTAMLAFAVLVGAALLNRRDAATHKRLMLLATIYISTAGFARWQGEWLGPLVGEGRFAEWVVLYSSVNLLALSIGVYDILTRRHLCRGYLPALAWIGLNQFLSVWLHTDPDWIAFWARQMG